MFYSLYDAIFNQIPISKNNLKNKTLQDLEDELIRLIRYFEKDVLHNVLLIIYETDFSINKEVFHHQIDFIEDLLENYFKREVDYKLKFREEWNTVFNKYPGLKESILKSKNTFMKDTKFNKQTILINLNLELQSHLGLDELDIIKSFYKEKMCNLIHHHIIYLEGNLLRAIRTFVQFI